MAIYKRYNTRKKRVRWGVIVWVLCILAVFAATVALGSYLGKKAESGESYLPLATGNNADSETITPLAERVMHGEYVSPEELASFTAADPFTYASTWLYRDGETIFATDTDAKLGKDTSALPVLSTFDIEAGTTGLFAVQSVYADEQVRDVITAYENALLTEFTEKGPSELVLLFEQIDAECRDRIIAFAKSAGNAVLCVPYSILHSEDCARFFSEAAEAGFCIALRAEGLTAEQLAADIADYSFYFTRYELRLVLSGSDEHLIEVLRENNALNYQFTSPRASADGGNIE